MREGSLLLSKILEATGGILISDKNLETFNVSGISSLELADSTQVSFIVKQNFIPEAKKSKAAAVFVKAGWDLQSKPAIVVKDPYWAYAITAQLFESEAAVFDEGISSDAIIDETAIVGDGASVAAGAIIGENVRIGKRTRIDARVVIEKNTIIGDDCHIQSGAILRYGVKIGCSVIIGSGAVIGSEGFANAFNGKRFERIPCFGSVLIEDGAEIGANSTIDRGNFVDTIIRKGARIDNLVMIAHNCEIGESCGIAAQVGFAGSTKIGKRVMIGGQAGFGGHVEIGDDSFVGGQAGIQQSYPKNSKITGSPAIDLMKRRRIDKIEENLPEIVKEVKTVRKELDELKEKLNG
jgi:UDP-3-O-[3-hydroxymyristoyl] glucosamine N-acyltransferase